MISEDRVDRAYRANGAVANGCRQLRVSPVSSSDNKPDRARGGGGREDTDGSLSETVNHSIDCSIGVTPGNEWCEHWPIPRFPNER